MSCRCCGSDPAQNSAVLSAQSNRNNNNDCFWPSFANLPRSTSPACCNSGGNSYNNRYVSDAYDNNNGNSNNSNNNNGCGRCSRCGR